MGTIVLMLSHCLRHDPKEWWHDFEKLHSTADAAALRGRLCLFGDSDVHYWEGRYPTNETVGVGVSGAEMRDIVGYAGRFVEKYAPKAVVWVGGANDFLASQEPQDIVEHFEEGAAAVPNSTLIIYMGSKRELVTVQFYEGYKKFNELMQAYAAGTPNVVYVHNWDDMQADDMYRWDGLHLSQEGYELWNCKVNALLRPGLSLADARHLAMNMSEVCPTARPGPAARARRLQ